MAHIPRRTDMLSCRYDNDVIFSLLVNLGEGIVEIFERLPGVQPPLTLRKLARHWRSPRASGLVRGRRSASGMLGPMLKSLHSNPYRRSVDIPQPAVALPVEHLLP